MPRLSGRLNDLLYSVRSPRVGRIAHGGRAGASHLLGRPYYYSPGLQAHPVAPALPNLPDAVSISDRLRAPSIRRPKFLLDLLTASFPADLDGCRTTPCCLRAESALPPNLEMMMPSTRVASRGFTFIEMLVALLLLAILCVLAVPEVREQVARMRARSALDRVAAEIYRARMVAVENGGPTHLVLQANQEGCIQGARLVAPRLGAQTPAAFKLDLPGLCLRHSGDSVLTFNSRGMLRPPARSLSVTYGAFSDSVLISAAGRIRRAYRRSRS